MTTKTPSPTFGTTIEASFEETVTRVIEALKQEGFGVLTTLDVQATMKAKLNLEFEYYTILGACNPHLAHHALELDRTVGALLPCNVVVHEMHDATSSARMRIDIADPVVMLGIIDQPAMQTLAQEARTRLQRVITALKESV